jgi:hypothetical protein
MSSTRAIQFLHSCTGALTTKHLSRSAVNFPRRHVIASRRYYSEEAKPPEEQKEEQKEDTQGSGDADSDLAAQLKKKDDQVVDVMASAVSPFRIQRQRHFLGSTALPPSRLSQLAT